MNWATLIIALVSPIARRVLTSLGIGLIAYTGVDLAVGSLLNSAKAAWSGGMGGAVAQLVAMSGANTALGIIAGGIVGRVSMIALKRFGVL